jgi:hypothetical protein
MTMTTTVTFVGAHALGWEPQPGQRVHVPGLDPAYVHTLREVTVSADRTRTTITVDTERPPALDLIQHLSVLVDHRAKAAVRAVHAGTGAVLLEGRFDAFLSAGQEVWIGGAPYTVTAVEHPNRHPVYGTVPEGLDWQHATVTPLALDEVRPIPGGEGT